jgi:small multidrug resistance family-3 protein
MVKTTITLLVVVTLSLFFAAAIAEIGGGYLVWSWIRKKKKLILGLVGGIILFIYGIVFSILWGVLVDKKKPDGYEIIGSFIVLAGTVIMYYAPRSSYCADNCDLGYLT